MNQSQGALDQAAFRKPGLSKICARGRNKHGNGLFWLSLLLFSGKTNKLINLAGSVRSNHEIQCRRANWFDILCEARASTV
jgi:hypothetical protein